MFGKSCNLRSFVSSAGAADRANATYDKVLQHHLCFYMQLVQSICIGLVTKVIHPIIFCMSYHSADSKEH